MRAPNCLTGMSKFAREVLGGSVAGCLPSRVHAVVHESARSFVGLAGLRGHNFYAADGEVSGGGAPSLRVKEHRYQVYGSPGGM